jgi:hypothetical protein
MFFQIWILNFLKGVQRSEDFTVNIYAYLVVVPSMAIPWKKNKKENHAVFAVVGIGSNPPPPPILLVANPLARTQTEVRRT